MQPQAQQRHNHEHYYYVSAEDGFFRLLPFLQGGNGLKEVLSVYFRVFSEHIDCNFDFLCVVSPFVGLAIICKKQRS